jgi:hypothetical protein
VRRPRVFPSIGAVDRQSRAVIWSRGASRSTCERVLSSDP